MNPWKHEDRSGCIRQLSSRPLRSRDHDQLSIWRNSLMGKDRERDKKNVTEMSEETHIEDTGESTGKPVAKARPKQTPSSMLSSTKIPVPCHERKWIDVERGRFDQSCLQISKLMISLIRHDDTAPREDGVVTERLRRAHVSRFTPSSSLD